jgi:hypothetical protein
MGIDIIKKGSVFRSSKEVNHRRQPRQPEEPRLGATRGDRSHGTVVLVIRERAQGGG